jgi:hypothetical protein
MGLLTYREECFFLPGYAPRAGCNCVYGKARLIATARGADPYTQLRSALMFSGTAWEEKSLIKRKRCNSLRRIRRRSRNT